MKNQRYVITITFIAALGGFLFGFDTAVISGANPFIEKYFNLDKLALGWAVSSVIVGCIIGAFSAGFVSDVFGRKKVLITTAVLFTFSAIGTALATDFNFFIIARILGGHRRGSRFGHVTYLYRRNLTGGASGDGWSPSINLPL